MNYLVNEQRCARHYLGNIAQRRANTIEVTTSNWSVRVLWEQWCDTNMQLICTANSDHIICSLRNMELFEECKEFDSPAKTLLYYAVWPDVLRIVRNS